MDETPRQHTHKIKADNTHLLSSGVFIFRSNMFCALCAKGSNIGALSLGYSYILNHKIYFLKFKDKTSYACVLDKPEVLEA